VNRSLRLPLDVTRPPVATFYVTGMDDAELVARVLAGDAAGFTVLVDRYYGMCLRFALRTLGNRHDAEDALQETFLNAYSALGRYRERQAFRAWLYRILINRCRSVGRQRQRRLRRFVEDGEPHDSAAGDSAGDGTGLRDALQSALDTLEPRLREAVVLKYGEGLEYHEMSAMTGAGVSALKMRVKRACQALRPLLEGERNE
jgi:RNA polymerase sigma-70 factor, ECF subfamily